jgi:hypothetical protein
MLAGGSTEDGATERSLTPQARAPPNGCIKRPAGRSRSRRACRSADLLARWTTHDAFVSAPRGPLALGGVINSAAPLWSGRAEADPFSLLLAEDVREPRPRFLEVPWAGAAREREEDERAHAPRAPKQPSQERSQESRARGERTSLGRPLGTTRFSEKECPTSAPSGPRRKSASEAPGAFRGRASPLRSGAQETTLRDVAVFPRGTWTTPHLSFGEAANMVFTTGAKGFRRGE